MVQPVHRRCIMWAVIHSPGLIILVETKLLLLCANTENTQDLKASVGKVWQGNASKAQIEPIQVDTNLIRNLSMWRHTERVPRACTAWRPLGVTT